MTKKELYLKTVFCCIACDGDIAEEEIRLIRELGTKDKLFNDMDTEKYINAWINEINKRGSMFLQNYLNEIATEDLNEKEQLLLVSLAFNAIEADNRIEYSEVKFFKKIRSRLSISDETILGKFPNKEDFLLPDLKVTELPMWDENIQFNQITIPTQGN
ncbi:TerB family tellurite resistance protein [Prevotella histicola]|uniref:tellurite resistance TerB family protein n=1 Tax=Prevotella histicola TaxID=470565 RepID=UPI0028ED06EE|nr:TerB family tellurite resistance protein [Prevotella histicola]